MKIYTLSPLGYRLSHSIRSPDTPEWRVVHYLARNHSASKEKLEADLGISSLVLAKLSQRRIIIPDVGVSIEQ